MLKFSQRPFADVEQMNQTLISNWNKVVRKPSDEIFILGDFMYRGRVDQANQILQQLRGKKYLIMGNHDHYLDRPEFDQHQFQWVKDYYTLNEQKIKFVLFHYPILEWDQYFHNAIHLYGHVHNTRSDYFRKILGQRAINVGVDMNGYQPISMIEIFEKLDNRRVDNYEFSKI